MLVVVMALSVAPERDHATMIRLGPNRRAAGGGTGRGDAVSATLSFTAEELAQVRFSVSPMWEVLTSFRVLSRPGLYPVHGPWFDQVRPRLAAAGLLTGPLSALFHAPSYVPDFLTPAPAHSAPSLEEELGAIRATPEYHLCADLDIYDEKVLNGAIPPFSERLRAHREQALCELSKDIEHYFQIALAPYWSRIKTLLETDIYYRARQVAEFGAARLFNDRIRTSAGTAGRCRCCTGSACCAATTMLQA